MVVNPKECPFCGGVPVIDKYMHPAGERYRVICYACMATVDTGTFQSWYPAVEAWNRRDKDRDAY